MGLIHPHGVEHIAGDPKDWRMAVQTDGGWFRTAVEIVEDLVVGKEKRRRCRAG